MFRGIILIVFAVFAVTALPVSAHAVTPPGADQWRTQGLNAVAANSPFQLFNERTVSPVGYGNRTFGVDLDWRARGGGDWVFRLRPVPGSNVTDHRRRAITPTERVALFNTKSKRYLTYQQRGSSKAELEWTRSSFAEWEVHAQWGTKFALFNARVDKYLVYQQKTFGINLGWAEDPPLTAGMPLRAKDVVQGYRPFEGLFGDGLKGKVLSIRNASAVNTLRFVHHRGTRNDCASVDKTVAVPRTGSLTSDQMRLLFGSTTPSLPLRVLACVAPGELEVATTYLDLTYKLES